MRLRSLGPLLGVAALAAAPAAGAPGGADPRCALWIDLARGEPVAFDAMLDDLAGARALYLGERHTVRRHHDLQASIVEALGRRGRPLSLALESLEAAAQPALDRYGRGEIDFESLARETRWEQRWPNYLDYRPLLEAARRLRAPVVGLNARAEVVRRVAAAGGVERLEPELRRELPAEMDLQAPLQARWLGRLLQVHRAATPERLRPMIEAQMVRDEAMAEALAAHLRSDAGRDRTAVVICGAAHAEYGLGIPDRLRRRMPDVKDRIALMSESGDVELSPRERAAAREIRVTHEDLRDLGRPIADYLHAMSLKPTGDKD
jgi:uncharacterized iron-regulated protein